MKEKIIRARHWLCVLFFCVILSASTRAAGETLQIGRVEPTPDPSDVRAVAAYNLNTKKGMRVIRSYVSKDGRFALYYAPPCGNSDKDKQTQRSIYFINTETATTIPIDNADGILKGMVGMIFWSYDGKSIALTLRDRDYSVSEADTTLYVLEPGQDKVRIKAALSSASFGKVKCSMANPQFSPDDKKVSFTVLFQADEKTRVSEMYVMDSDGKNLKKTLEASSNRDFMYRWIEPLAIKYRLWDPKTPAYREMLVRLNRLNNPLKPELFTMPGTKFYDKEMFMWKEGLTAEADMDADGEAELFSYPDFLNDPQRIYYREKDMYMTAKASETPRNAAGISMFGISSRYYFIKNVKGGMTLVRISPLGRVDIEYPSRIYSSGLLLNTYAFADKKLTLLNSYFSDYDIYGGKETDVPGAPMGRDDTYSAVFNKENTELTLDFEGRVNVINADGVMRKKDE